MDGLTRGLIRALPWDRHPPPRASLWMWYAPASESRAQGADPLRNVLRPSSVSAHVTGRCITHTHAHIHTQPHTHTLDTHTRTHAHTHTHTHTCVHGCTACGDHRYRFAHLKGFRRPQARLTLVHHKHHVERQRDELSH